MFFARPIAQIGHDYSTPLPMHRLAILDMNAGHPNQGMRCIRQIAANFTDAVEIVEFDVRSKGELPGTDFDVYISSGGPGSPLASGEDWERRYMKMLDELWYINRNTDDPREKKYCFFICFSFQLVSRYFSSGSITERRSMSFGTFPVHSSNEGDVDILFEGLDDPFYVADFRDFQVVRANYSSLGATGGSVLAFEKYRPHVPYERAIMAIRWSNEWVGTQFHPEADAEGLILYFQDEARKAVILEEHGQSKFDEMMAHLADDSKIKLTNEVIIPGFIKRALQALESLVPA